MIRLDSIKMKLPIDALVNIKNEESSNMILTTKTIAGNHYESLLQKPFNQYGIGNTIVKDSEIILSLSAKVLLDDYLEGINKNTIETALDNYNKVSNILIDKNKALEGSFLSCDNFQMIKPDSNYTLSDCINSMTLLKTNDNFSVDVYDKRHNQGVVLTHNIKSEKRRLILYNKHIELMLANTSKFLKNCNRPDVILDQVKNCLRVEQNNASFKSMKNRFASTSTKIFSILESAQNPNHLFIDKYNQSVKQLDIFKDRYDKVDDCIKDIGMKGLLKECNYDFDIVRTFLMMNTNAHKRSINRALSRLKSKYIQIQKEKELAGKNPYEINNHIIELIKSAG